MIDLIHLSQYAQAELLKDQARLCLSAFSFPATSGSLLRDNVLKAKPRDELKIPATTGAAKL